jgi:polysaccharide export outer membrane protein
MKNGKASRQRNGSRSAAWMAATVLLASLSAGDLLSQTGSQTGIDRRSLGSTLERLSSQEPRPPESPIPLEGVVDENEYVVGPGDIFSFLIPGVTVFPLQLVVSPEGTLAIPNGGEFTVHGKTLKSVKEQIRSSITAARPSLTLLTPRTFVITILGAVEKPGSYVASAVTRVDKALALAGASPSVDPSARRFSTRRIVLRRTGIPDRIVDLERFYAFQRSGDNPFLREGDLVIVPPRALDQTAVSVYGGVQAPGQYEFRDGDSLVALIKIAQGLAPIADPTVVELTRLTPDGSSATSFVYDITPIIAGKSPDILIQNKDRIVVREVPDRRGDFKVVVRGEVKFPGTYPITPDSTRLSDIIRRAGGFTEFASLPMAEVERRQTTPQGVPLDLSREALLNLRMNDQLVTPEERAYYDLEATLRRGTVSVDFVALFERGDTTNDILLGDGDVVFVPASNKTVYVYGQVARPGYVPYKDGANLRYYIEKAGGYGDKADAGNSRIIKGKTREWLGASDTVIEPGDYIWVPKDIKYPTAYYLNLVSQAASFISVVLSMTVIILQITGSN